MTELYLWLGGLLAALVSIFAYGRSQKSKGRKEAESDAIRDAQERIERGRKAVNDGRASGNEPDQRLRDNDGRW